MRKKILLVVYGVFLSGCNSYHNDFVCKAEKGYQCHNMSQVKEIIENDKSYNKDDYRKAYFSKNALSFNGDTANILGGKLSRRPEKIMKIWFTSHIDKNNNFVTDRYVYTVIEESNWVVG